MFRIRDIDELRRMVMLLRGLNNSTVKFPVDIFRDAEQISAVQCGKRHRCSFAYTNADGCAAIDGPVHAKDLRHSLHAMEKQFEEERIEKELEEEEEKANVQDT